MMKKYGLAKSEIDDMAYKSHLRAAKATTEGRFKREIVPVPGKDPKVSFFFQSFISFPFLLSSPVCLVI